MAKMGVTRGIKNHLVAFLGEFVGTFLFLFFAFGGTQVALLPSSANSNATGPQLNALLYIALVFGFSLAINVWVFFRVSGGLFNPAVTLALCVVGVVPPLRSFLIFIAQLLGGIAAAAAVKGLLPGNQVLFAVGLTNGTTVNQGFWLEFFFTFELVFTILMLAAERTKATFVAPVGIGLSLFVAELFGLYWTGGALNPARAFGPAVIAGSFPVTHWIYWIGPLLGALLAAAFYKLLKILHYEDVNGDQDKAEHELPEEGKTDEGKESHRGSDRRRRRSHRSDQEHRASNGYSTNRQSGRYAQSGPHPPPIAAAGPIPPVSYPNGQRYVQNIHAQDRTTASYPRTQGYDMPDTNRRSSEATR